MIRLTPVETARDAERAGSELNRTGRALATTEQHAAYESGLDEVEAGRFVGPHVARKEDPRFLTGRGLYIDDVILPGMLHVAFVRSPHPRAAITASTPRQPRRWTGSSPSHLRRHRGGGRRRGVECGPAREPSGRARRVCFVGDPVVLVVAESRALAEDACELVDVEYEPRPRCRHLAAVADTDELVHPELESNVAARPPRRPTTPSSTRRSRPPPHVVTETIASTGTSRCRWRRAGIVA